MINRELATHELDYPRTLLSIAVADLAGGYHVADDDDNPTLGDVSDLDV